MLVDAETVERRCPLYYAKIARRTPLRSVLALPLSINEQAPFAAMDLHSERHDLSSVLDLDVDVASERVAVCTAVGMLLAHAGLDDLGALARLRAHACSHDINLDETAAQLLDRGVQVEDVLAWRPGRL